MTTVIEKLFPACESYNVFDFASVSLSIKIYFGISEVSLGWAVEKIVCECYSILF